MASSPISSPNIPEPARTEPISVFRVSAFSFSPLGSPQFFRLNRVDAAGSKKESWGRGHRAHLFPLRIMADCLFLHVNRSLHR